MSRGRGICCLNCAVPDLKSECAAPCNSSTPRHAPYVSLQTPNPPLPLQPLLLLLLLLLLIAKVSCRAVMNPSTCRGLCSSAGRDCLPLRLPLPALRLLRLRTASNGRTQKQRPLLRPMRRAAMKTAAVIRPQHLPPLLRRRPPLRSPIHHHQPSD